MNGINDSCKIYKKVFEDSLTRQDVEIVAKRAFGPATRIVDYYVTDYSKEKVGFMGSHRYLVINVQRESSIQCETHNFFLKSIPYDNQSQVEVIEDSGAFVKETLFYERILPELTTGIKDKSWAVQCYLVKNDLMVLEDLKSRNFTIKGKILDMTHLKSALTGLAKLHASSILTEKRLGKTLDKVYPVLLDETLFGRKGQLAEWFRTGVDVVTAVAKKLGLDHTRVPAVCDLIFDSVRMSKTYRNVINHGDAWSFNIMFDNTIPRPKCALVDFQSARYVPSTVDVAQILYLTTKKEFRKEHEKGLLKYYHDALCSTLIDNDDQIELPSFEALLQEYEDMRIVGIVTAALYFPVNQIDSRMSAELAKDSDGYAKLVVQDRVELVLDIMQKDNEYSNRITDIVRELVQKSTQLLL